MEETEVKSFRGFTHETHEVCTWPHALTSPHIVEHFHWCDMIKLKETKQEKLGQSRVYLHKAESELHGQHIEK